MAQDSKWSAIFKFNKHSNKLCANLISFRIHSLLVSDAPIRFGRDMTENHLFTAVCSFKRVCVPSKLPSPMIREFTLHFVNLFIVSNKRKNVV